MAKTIRGGTALGSGVEEGDEVLRVDGFHVVRGSTSVDEVSSHIRGKEGSIVTMVVRKPSGEVRTIRLVRARLPGHKTELLGALWQSPGKKVSREMTIGDKLDVLGQLHRRGNLTDTEYHSARRRLIEGSQHYEPREPEYKQHVAKNINSLSVGSQPCTV